MSRQPTEQTPDPAEPPAAEAAEIPTVAQAATEAFTGFLALYKANADPADRKAIEGDLLAMAETFMREMEGRGR